MDGIICEDTRRASILLNHYGIKKPLMVLNDFNESKEFPHIIDKLQQGQNLALISDAGTPLISDPGFKLVRECLNQNIPVDSLPGPSSVLTALILSGLPPDKFLFLGYLPEKEGHRKELLRKISSVQKNIKITFVILISPHKLTRTLQDMLKILGDKPVTLAHELTKIHQTVSSRKVSDWASHFKNSLPKGEYILLFN